MSWKKSTIGDVLCVLKNGINCEQNKIPNGNKITRIETIAKKRFDFECVGYANLDEIEKEKSRLKAGDILFSHINSPIHVGKTAIYEGEEEIYHGINLLLMRTKEDVDPYFFNYFLNNIFSAGYWEQNCKKSVNQASVNQKDISKVEFNYPPITTQQKIVTKLEAIFDEIDKARAATEANAKNSYGLYSSAIDTFFENLDDKSVKLSACTEIGYGYTSKSSVDFDGPHYLRITDIQDDNVDWLLVPRIQDTEVEVKKFLLKDGDIVFARTGATTGKSFLVAEPPISVFASYLIRVDADRSLVLPEYLRHFFRSEGYWNAINAGISGAAQGGFNASKLGELAFPLPALEKQKKIVEELTAIEMLAISSKKSFEMKVKLLESLKNSILRKAFNGELVKD